MSARVPCAHNISLMEMCFLTRLTFDDNLLVIDTVDVSEENFVDLTLSLFKLFFIYKTYIQIPLIKLLITKLIQCSIHFEEQASISKSL